MIGGVPGYRQLKIFVGYTSSDRDWAHWIGWQLREAGHEAFVHEWEIGAGENVPRWMEERLGEASALLGVFSDEYCKAIYSQSERWAAYWQDPGGRLSFLIPIEVKKVTKWPVFVEPLKRLSLLGLDESIALHRLLEFLSPPKAPTEKPSFPGVMKTDAPETTSFAAGGDVIGSGPPAFPAASADHLRNPSSMLSSAAALDAETLIRCIDGHEPKPTIFGREEEIDTIASAILEGKVAIVAGGPGMGKTALATAAIYDPRVVSYFGRRRVFASLETATEARAILAKLVEAIGLPPTGDEISLMRILETNAAERPLATILDNAETVFDIDRAGSERLLSLVANINGLSVVITIRGVPPVIPGAVSIDELPKLPVNPARAAFLAVAGATFQGDPDLPSLLEALDGHALSIRLVAAQAIGLPSLRGLRESWDDAHAEILRISGEEESRLTSVRASLALSLNSRRMKSNPLARRLLALLAFLPSGLAEADVRPLVGERGLLTRAKANEAIGCLHQLRLVERRPDLRLRMLTPLRECVKADTSPLDVDKICLVERYLELATKAEKIGSLDWEKFREEIEAEADNVDAICDLAVTGSFAQTRLDKALDGLTKFHVFSGRGEVGSVTRALVKLQLAPQSRALIKGLERLGDIASARSNFETARLKFEEAISLARQFGILVDEANCLHHLGRIALAKSDREAARHRFQEALAVYQRVGNRQGIANAVHALGLIALGRSDHQMARSHFEEAIRLYRQLHEAVGEANTIRSIGDLAFEGGDYETARARFEEALALYRRTGVVLGEANCIGNLSDVSRRRSDYKTACAFLEEALVLAKRLGAVSGEGRCMSSFGLISYAQSDYGGARARFEEAIALYRRVGDLLSQAETTIRLGQARQKMGDVALGLTDIKSGFALYFGIADAEDRARAGWQAMQLALTTADHSEATTHRELARSAWMAVGRLDLVQEWVDQT